MTATDLFGDLLSELSTSRQAHTREVGRKAESVASLVSPWLRGDLVVAATLHDIGYAHRVTGFHALDGARFLASRGFSNNVCNLVARHSASEVEAKIRRIDLSVFEEFDVDVDLEVAHSVIAWADMTLDALGIYPAPLSQHCLRDLSGSQPAAESLIHHGHMIRP